MIEYDRSEYMYTDLDEKSLELIEWLLGYEVRDALYVPDASKVVEDVRFPNQSA
ncbi:hypothetical protein D3C76_674880 [compost metagenome]